MSCWEVKDYLNQVTDLENENPDSIIALCRSSLKEIEAGLKADADRDDIRVIAAAAGLSYYKLMLKRCASESKDEITDFKAGDVSITAASTDLNKALNDAEVFCQKMLEKIIPLCEDNNFAFCQVEVMT